jgi:signal transduction histidine kinase/ligand-binding sensor domain-containing protein
MDLPAQGKSLALVILILGMGLAAPGTAFGLSELGYYRLGTREGLAGDTVYAILQDERGQMWFGSTGGISRFDGHSFATYRPRFDGRSFASSRVLSLVQDRSGLIWIGTDGGGVSSFDPDTGSFVNFGSERGLRGDRIGALGLDGLGRLVAGSAEGYIDRYDQAAGGFLPFCEREGAARISGILRDSRGRIWVATKGEGLERYSDEGFREAVYRHEAKDPSSISSDAVSAIFEDSFGGLWTGTEEGGVDLFREGRFSHAGKSPKALPVRSLAEDPEGRLWIGYQDGGFDLLDPSSMLPIAGQPKENISVLAMRRDSGGLVWAGTENEGLRVYNLRSSLFRRMARRNSAGKAAGVTGFALLRNGGALASTDSMGIVRPDPVSGSLLLQSGFPGLAAGIVSATGPLLESTDGSLYCGTSGGLFALSADGSSRIFRHDPGSAGAIAGDSVLSLCEDGKGALWVGLENAGLDRFDPGKGVFSHHAPGGRGGRGHPPTSVTALIRDSSGRLWAGTRDAGLWRLDPGTEEFVAHSGGRGEPSPIGDSCVTALYEDGDGNIWAGTGGAGLVRLDPESGAFVHYGEDEGFYGDSVQAIVEDRAGILWIASSAGLYSFDRNLGDFFCFGAEDGLVPGSFSPGALARGADGRIWVGSSGGATVFDPVSVPRYAPQPEIAISGSVLGETAKKTLSGDASPVAIGYDNRGLEFSISVIDYTAPSRNRYAMKLDGKQESWTFLGRNNSAFLAPLAPGRYTLRVKGSNGNGIWNNYGASLSIVVASPFWATWWFRTLAAILLLAATSLGILARILALRKRNELLVKFSRHVEEAREEERRIAAREVHDEIGQHLTVLNFHAYWLASHPEARAAESAERVASIRKGIGEAMESVKSVATKLRPAVLDTLDFSGALRWYSGDFARLSGIEVALSVGDGVALPAGELATALFRVLQEMLGNVMRHSGAAQVRISFGEAEGAYLLEVGDDGAGMEPGRATRQDSFGIIGMKERCASFGGSLEISSAPGKGTTIRARIPKPAGGST